MVRVRSGDSLLPGTQVAIAPKLPPNSQKRSERAPRANDFRKSRGDSDS
jgi:hypothetical protein